MSEQAPNLEPFYNDNELEQAVRALSNLRQNVYLGYLTVLGASDIFHNLFPDYSFGEPFLTQKGDNNNEVL